MFRKIIIIIAVVVAVLLLTGCTNWFSSAPKSPSETIFDEVSETSDFFSGLKKNEVVRVKDGDTYVLSIDGEETTVRLIGVDTPESVAPSEYSKENTSEGATISEIVKQKIKPGDELYIEYDVSRTDKYSRTLAYLYFEDGVMVQEWLLSNGYAQTMTIQPNSKYAEKFAEIQHIAAENKVGLWNGYFDGE